MAGEGGRAQGLDRLVEAVEFSQDFGQTGVEVQAAVTAAVEGGLNPAVIGLAVFRARVMASSGGSTATREAAIDKAEDYLVGRARSADGALKAVLENLALFIGKAKRTGTLAERLRAFDRLLEYLWGRAVATIESDAAAKDRKRKRKDDVEDKPPGGGKTGGRAAKGTGKPVPKSAASKGQITGRASRAGTRAKARAANAEHMGIFLIRMIKDAVQKENLAEDVQDTACSELTTERAIL